VRYLLLEFEREAKNFGYQIKASTDGSTWQTIASKGRAGSLSGVGLHRHSTTWMCKLGTLRIEFTRLQANAWAGLKEFERLPGQGRIVLL